jgi:RNA polymerase sigma factor (sigma-70 family)
MTDTADAPPAAAAADNAVIARHYPWVRAAAMRRVHDAHLADDVAQAVFILLMEKRPAFSSEAVLAAWLFQTMRYASAHALRSQRRRAYHESRAADEAAAATTMRAAGSESSSDQWSEIAPLLDQSVARLRREDRQVVLLRFYQQKTYGAVGAAMGISEEAARKRVDRAVEKLRHALTRRGVAVPSASVLATTLLTHTTPTTPVVPLTATTAAASGAAAGQIAKGIAMSWTPAKIAAVTIIVVAGIPAVATVAYLSLGSNHPPAAQPSAPQSQVAQSPDATTTPVVPASTAPAEPVSQTDPIIPDDLLSVSITDLVGPGIESVKQCRVDPDSNITLPLVGAVSVKGMVMRQAELAIQKTYRDANLMPNAKIRIGRIESGKSPLMRWARVGVGDFIRVDIADLVGPGVETTITDRVSDTGQIALPQAGSIKVVGLSENQLAKAIQVRYRQQNLMPNAQVQVQRITEQQAKGQPRVKNGTQRRP